MVRCRLRLRTLVPWPLTRSVALVAVVAVVFGPAGPQARAAQIDLRLDVTYSGANPAAGGSWNLFARSDGQGIFSLGVDVIDIDNSVQFSMPTGTVNGSDPAGFATRINNPVSGGRRLIVAQQALGPGSVEQGAFYGVGTLFLGSPNYPGAIGGTNRIGPTLSTLTGVQNIPWATTDPIWLTGVKVASGTFSPGDAPRFNSNSFSPSGAVFTSLGTVGSLGSVTNSIAFTSQVRTNLVFGVATGDYNGDGVVDAADYTVWRDSEGQTVPTLTGADGSGDGQINHDDYLVWVNHFGSSSPATAQAIPEPQGLALVLVTALVGASRGRGPAIRRLELQ